MDSSDDDFERQYTVLVNDEGQYSLWPAGKVVPNGWTQTGKTSTSAECARYVDEVWTDMRPRSLRENL